MRFFDVTFSFIAQLIYPSSRFRSEIVRKRRHHEYSLQKRNKRILDYDAYISTEITIMKLLRFRRQVEFIFIRLMF